MSKQRHGIGGYLAQPSGENPYDFFPTPEPVTRAFLDSCPLPDGLWCEPACGDGAVVRAVGARRGWVTFDIRDVPTPIEGAGHLPLTNFLELDLQANTFDVVITNPPF